MKKLMIYIYSILTLLLGSIAFAHSNKVIVQNNIRLQKDSVVKNQFLNSLNELIENIEIPTKRKHLVLQNNLLSTSALFEEMQNINKKEENKEDINFKPYLNNVVKISDSTYITQLSYIGVKDTTAILKASYTLIAQSLNDKFYFSSPLNYYTNSWKDITIGKIRFHYKDTINFENATKYSQLVSKYDKILKTSDYPIEYYCCDNLHEAFAITGVDYKADYNAYRTGSLSALENNKHLNVNGVFTSDFTDVDPHDLWHSRLYKVVSNEKINKPVDEGTAYLYGGSWGFSWEQILTKFKEYAKSNPNSDWISEYNESKNFDKKGKYPLNVDMVINALMIQKIEKEKEIEAVLELVTCGKKQKDNENYFIALEKITGISKLNFNKEVDNLIRAN